MSRHYSIRFLIALAILIAAIATGILFLVESPVRLAFHEEKQLVFKSKVNSKPPSVFEAAVEQKRRRSAPKEVETQISNFAQPQLAETLNPWFSRIGPGQSEFPYSQSGFDTEQNSELAYETILAFPYESPTREDIQANLLAISHLKFSELPASRERLIELTRHHMERIDRAKTSARELMALDLGALASAVLERDPEQVTYWQRTSNSALVRDQLALAIQSHFEAGPDENKWNAQLSAELKPNFSLIERMVRQ